MDRPHALNSSDALDTSQIGSVSTEIERPTLDVTRGLTKIWKDKVDLDGKLPEMSAFSPLKLSSLMPYVYVIEQQGDTDSFRVKFMGTAIVQSIGLDLTGASVPDQEAHSSSWRVDVYKAVLARKEPIFTAVNLGDFEREYTKTECVLLPVADPAGEARFVVCAAAPYPADG